MYNLTGVSHTGRRQEEQGEFTGGGDCVIFLRGEFGGEKLLIAFPPQSHSFLGMAMNFFFFNYSIIGI